MGQVKEYELFKAKSNIGDLELYIKADGVGKNITIYKNGKEIENMELQDEDLENYEENETEIILYLCNDEIIIQKSSRVEIDRITAPNEYIVSSIVSKQKHLSLNCEKSEWETVSRIINCAIKNKGYTKEQVKEIINNLITNFK